MNCYLLNLKVNKVCVIEDFWNEKEKGKKLFIYIKIDYIIKKIEKFKIALIKSYVMKILENFIRKKKIIHNKLINVLIIWGILAIMLYIWIIKQ